MQEQILLGMLKVYTDLRAVDVFIDSMLPSTDAYKHLNIISTLQQWDSVCVCYIVQFISYINSTSIYEVWRLIEQHLSHTVNKHQVHSIQTWLHRFLWNPSCFTSMLLIIFSSTSESPQNIPWFLHNCTGCSTLHSFNVLSSFNLI